MGPYAAGLPPAMAANSISLFCHNGGVGSPFFKTCTSSEKISREFVVKSTFMKTIRWSAVFVVTGGLVVPFAVQAHDPKEHLEDAESPNCVALRDMEQVKTDPNDPVMQAIMKQCMDELHHDDEEEGATGSGEQSEPAGSGAPHTDQPG